MVPIKRILNIIDSCISFEQLETCERLTDLYVNRVKKDGVVNFTSVKENLLIHINERREELKIVYEFN